jgi:hypothetical protein
MFQPRLKLEFVRRYCSPRDGWLVSVDIDSSEMGNTGGERKSEKSKERQRQMEQAGSESCDALALLGVRLGRGRAAWMKQNAVPQVKGDRDIIAFHKDKRLLLIAEVEGESSGQPEQKLYKAMGQLVMAASEPVPSGWRRVLVLVVVDGKMTPYLQRVEALTKLGISRLALATTPKSDWCSPNATPFGLVSQP